MKLQLVKVNLHPPILVPAPQPSHTCHNFMCRSKGGSTETTEPLCKGGVSSATYKSTDIKLQKDLSFNLFMCFQVQGLIISQMLRKSVETRDWVNTIEPRNVRAVMKRVVEDTTSIDVQVQFAFCSNHHLRLSPQSYSLHAITMCGERIF